MIILNPYGAPPPGPVLKPDQTMIRTNQNKRVGTAGQLQSPHTIYFSHNMQKAHTLFPSSAGTMCALFIPANEVVTWQPRAPFPYRVHGGAAGYPARHIWSEPYWRSDKAQHDGPQAELQSAHLMEASGWRAAATSRMQNMVDHIDFHWWGTTETVAQLGAFNVPLGCGAPGVPALPVSFTTDVKSLKSLHRGDASQNSMLWLEFETVRGAPGWLMSPHLDVITVQMASHRMGPHHGRDVFLLLNRQALADWANWRLPMHCTPWATRSWDAMYKFYRRSDRPLERVAMVSIQDAWAAAGCGILQ